MINNVLRFGGRYLQEGGGIYTGEYVLATVIELFLVQAVIIIATCRALSVTGYYLRQPTVIFEIIGGIILGKSSFCIVTLIIFYSNSLGPSAIGKVEIKI